VNCKFPEGDNHLEEERERASRILVLHQVVEDWLVEQKAKHTTPMKKLKIDSVYSDGYSQTDVKDWTIIDLISGITDK
jgi:hypothetical protein